MKKLKGKARERSRKQVVHPKHNSRKRVAIMRPELNRVLAVMTSWQIKMFNRFGHVLDHEDARTFLNDKQREKLDAAG